MQTVTTEKFQQGLVYLIFMKYMIVRYTCIQLDRSVKKLVLKKCTLRARRQAGIFWIFAQCTHNLPLHNCLNNGDIGCWKDIFQPLHDCSFFYLNLFLRERCFLKNKLHQDICTGTNNVTGMLTNLRHYLCGQLWTIMTKAVTLRRSSTLLLPNKKLLSLNMRLRKNVYK